MKKKDLQKKEVKVGNTKFFFTEMKSIAGIPVIEKIRFAISKIDVRVDFNKIGEGTGEEEFMLILKLCLGIDPKFSEELRCDVFPYVHYQNESTTKQVLHGSEDQAFAKLSIMQIYEVWIRAMVVNFYPFFQDAHSFLADMGWIEKEEKVQS